VHVTIGNSWRLLKDTYNEWDRHQAPKLGAALSYYTVLSLAPLLIVVLTVVGIALGKQAARGEIIGQLQSMLGQQGAHAIETVITNADKPATGTVASILGLITLFIGASGVFGELRDSLNRIWDVPSKESSGLLAMIRQRFLSFGMVLAIGFLLLVSLVISAALSAAGKFMGGLMPVPSFVLEGVNLLVSLGIITVLFALIFRFLPDERPLARRVARRVRDFAPVHARQVSDRSVPGQSERRIGLRRRRIARNRSGMGLLFSTDLLLRGGIHARVCDVVWQLEGPPEGTGDQCRHSSDRDAAATGAGEDSAAAAARRSHSYTRA
jgi:YihY family inner membrane protein